MASSSKQLTLFGSIASGPPEKRRKFSESFKESWKDTALWPRVDGMELSQLPKTWLEHREGLGMFCTLCTKYGKVPRSGVPVWTKEPCVLLRHESITRHMNSNMHEDAE